MKRVHVFENACCGKSPSEALVPFLRKRFGDEIELRVFDLGKDGGDLPVPPGLVLKLNTEGERCLPSLVVDGVPVTLGWLPNLMEAVMAVETGQVPARQASRQPMAVLEENGYGGCC